MDSSIESIITEILDAIQTEYNFLNKHFENIKFLVSNLVKTIKSSGKICKFMDSMGSSKRYCYNIVMPYIVVLLSKYTDLHLMIVFETIYMLDRFKKEIERVSRTLNIEVNKRFNLSTTTLSRVANSFRGSTYDIIIGWLPSAGPLTDNLDAALFHPRCNMMLMLIGNEYLTHDHYDYFEDRINAILQNGFKIRQ